MIPASRDYVEISANDLTRAEGEEIAQSAIQDSLYNCLVSQNNSFLVKYDRNPNSVLQKYNSHKVRTRKHGAQKLNMAHFEYAEGEERRTLVFKDD